MIWLEHWHSRVAMATTISAAGLTVVGMLIGSVPTTAEATGDIGHAARAESVCVGLEVALDSITSGTKGDQVVLQSLTVPYNSTTRIASFLTELKRAPGLSDRTWQAFVRENETSHAACDEAFRSKFVSLEAPPSSWKNAAVWWRSFRDRHPTARGWTAVSGIGVNPSGTEMFVVVTFDVSLVGGGRYQVLLRKEKPADRWRIQYLHYESTSE